MVTIKPTDIDQERQNEASLDEELAAAAEQVAAALGERDRRIEELQRENEALGGTMSEGSAQRTSRMSRKRRALEALQKVLGTAIVAAFIVTLSSGMFGTTVIIKEQPAPVASLGPFSAGFQNGSAG